MQFQVKSLDGKGTVLSVSGEIGFSEVPELERGLGQAMCSGGPVLVDLSGVSFIASDGLGAFIRAQTQAHQRGVLLLLVHPQPQILGVLCKTQLTKFFRIYPSLEEAAADLG